MGMPDPSRIQYFERQSRNVDILLQHVPGRTGDIGHDCPVLFQKTVQEGGFAHIRFSDDRRGDPLAQHSSVAMAGDQLIDALEQTPHIVGKRMAGWCLDLFFRKIDPRFDCCDDRYKPVPESCHL